jgi:hypothetical protein
MLLPEERGVVNLNIHAHLVDLAEQRAQDQERR